MTPDDPRHGEERGYFAHLNDDEKACESCTTAHRAAEKVRTMRRMNGLPSWVPALGSQRRIRALMAIGWRLEDISAHAGWKASHEPARNVLNKTNVTRKTADRIAAVYSDLSDKRGPSTRIAARTRIQGWPGPSSWLGADLDDPDATPDPGWSEPSRGERFPALVENFDWLVSQGESEETAAERLGIRRLDHFKDSRRRMQRGQDEVA